jgi:hypothetical protein
MFGVDHHPKILESKSHLAYREIRSVGVKVKGGQI